MPAYKDGKKGTWYVQFSFKDRRGNRKHTTKRGFATKKEAQKWEFEFKEKEAGSLGMTFGSFAEIYLETIRIRVRESTYLMKDNIIRKHIIPYFKDKKLEDISTRDIMEWQNMMMQYINPKNGRPFSKSYLKSIHSQMSAIFNFAIRYYGLKCNPAAIVGNMGNDREVEIKFWTQDQYREFSEIMMEKPLFFYCFEVLYWCGLREGEMLALQPGDIDFRRKEISVTKTFQHINGRDCITPPKTRKSKRHVTMPDFLCEELQDYLEYSYILPADGRLFPTTKSALNREIKIGAEKAGLPEITVHSLRHSHVSLLIDQGYTILGVADRIGHGAKDFSWRYAHLFPSVQTDMANRLNDIQRGWYETEE